jgi:hypothetical protein
MEHDGQLVENLGARSFARIRKLQKLRRRSEKSRRRQGQRGPLPLPFPLLPPADAAHCGMCRGPRLGHDFGRAVHEPPSPRRGGSSSSTLPTTGDGAITPDLCRVRAGDHLPSRRLEGGP